MSTPAVQAQQQPAPSDATSALADLKLAAVWGVLAGLSTAALMPHLAQMMPERFARLPVSLGALATIQSLQALVLMGALAWLGLRMSHRTGLGSPLLRAWVIARRNADWSRLDPGRTAVLGMVTGLAIVALSALTNPLLPAMAHPPARSDAEGAALNGLLASFYGGIAEELQLRLFVMTLLVWIAARLRRTRLPAAAYWIAIAAAALLFGVGHLPAAAQVWGLDGIVIARTLLLNGLGGMVFGWLYWRRGLEMAMLGHFCADLVLHVAVPLTHLGATP
jgi:membrane protease YdiL (CAAX protease family)